MGVRRVKDWYSAEHFTFEVLHAVIVSVGEGSIDGWWGWRGWGGRRWVGVVGGWWGWLGVAKQCRVWGKGRHELGVTVMGGMRQRGWWWRCWRRWRGKVRGAEVGMLGVAGAAVELVVDGVSGRWAVGRMESVRGVGEQQWGWKGWWKERHWGQWGSGRVRGGRGWGVEVLAASGKRPRRAGREVRSLMWEVKTAYMPSTVYQAAASDWADVS